MRVTGEECTLPTMRGEPPAALDLPRGGDRPLDREERPGHELPPVTAEHVIGGKDRPVVQLHRARVADVVLIGRQGGVRLDDELVLLPPFHPVTGDARANPGVRSVPVAVDAEHATVRETQEVRGIAPQTRVSRLAPGIAPVVRVGEPQVAPRGLRPPRVHATHQGDHDAVREAEEGGLRHPDEGIVGDRREIVPAPSPVVAPQEQGAFRIVEAALRLAARPLPTEHGHQEATVRQLPHAHPYPRHPHRPGVHDTRRGPSPTAVAGDGGKDTALRGPGGAEEDPPPGVQELPPPRVGDQASVRQPRDGRLVVAPVLLVGEDDHRVRPPRPAAVRGPDEKDRARVRMREPPLPREHGDHLPLRELGQVDLRAPVGALLVHPHPTGVLHPSHLRRGLYPIGTRGATSRFR